MTVNIIHHCHLLRVTYRCLASVSLQSQPTLEVAPCPRLRAAFSGLWPSLYSGQGNACVLSARSNADPDVEGRTCYDGHSRDAIDLQWRGLNDKIMACTGRQYKVRTRTDP